MEKKLEEAIMEPGEKFQEKAERGYYWKAKPLIYLVYVTRKLREKPMTINELVEEFKKDWERKEGEKDEWLRRLKQELRKLPDDRTIRDYVKKALYALKDIGFVRKSKGRWEVYWYEFGSQKEYYMYLRKLMEECVFKYDDIEQAEVHNLIFALIKELNLLREIGDIRAHVACEKLLPELQQSYPETYSRIKEAARAMREEINTLDELDRKISKIVEARGFKGLEIYEDLKNKGARGISLTNLRYVIHRYLDSEIKEYVRLEVVDDKITVRGIVLALGRELKEEVERIVNEILSSEDVWNLWNKYKRLEGEKKRALNEVKEALIELYSYLDILLSAASTSSTK